jgi:hypothetical protein
VTKTSFRDHIICHFDKKFNPLKCSQCSLFFRNRQKLRNHEKKAHDPSPVKCLSICEDFGVSSNLFSQYIEKLYSENGVPLRLFFDFDRLSWVSHQTRSQIHEYFLQLFTLHQILSRQNQIFYDIAPRQRIIAYIKSRALHLLEQSSTFENFTRNVLQEFWSYVKTNVCNEDTGVVANLTESSDGVTGIALQIFYSASVTSNENEFLLQQNIYLNLFSLLQSALQDKEFGVSAFSLQKRVGEKQWCSFMGFMKRDD